MLLPRSCVHLVLMGLFQRTFRTRSKGWIALVPYSSPSEIFPKRRLIGRSGMKGTKSLAFTIACLSVLALAGCAALSSLFGLTPTADIKDGDRVVSVGAVVELDGRQSSSNVSYKWTIKSKPSTSSASISNPTAAIASFTADLEEIGRAHV